MQSQFLKPTSVMNPVWISLHLIIDLKTDSGEQHFALFYCGFTLVSFGFGYLQVFNVSGFYVKTHRGFGGSFEHQLVLFCSESF